MTDANDRGFSLIEVLLVCSMVAVLAAIALPHYSETRAQSLDARLASAVRHVATGEEAYYADRQRYTTAVEDLDGIVVVEDTSITIEEGNSGDISTSFRIRGKATGAAHTYVWLSDPVPGEPNLFVD